LTSLHCGDERNLIDIESYAYVGKIRSISIYKCGKKRKYIAVETIEGQKICSPCLEEDIVNISSRMLELYLKNVKLAIST
jgi:hypothetical protein